VSLRDGATTNILICESVMLFGLLKVGESGGVLYNDPKKSDISSKNEASERECSRLAS